MLYYKDKGMKYTDMCIWFDGNFYKEDRDEERLYKYLYLLCVMLAGSKHYFNTQKEYDDFGQYAAGVIWCRMTSKYEKSGEKVKSILNYLKGSIYGISCNFRTSEYRDISDRRDVGIINGATTELKREKFEADLKSLVESFVSNFKTTFNTYIDSKYQRIDSGIKEALYQQLVFNLVDIFNFKNSPLKLKQVAKKLEKIKDRQFKLKINNKSLIAYKNDCINFLQKELGELSSTIYNVYLENQYTVEESKAIQKENTVSALIGAIADD